MSRLSILATSLLLVGASTLPSCASAMASQSPEHATHSRHASVVNAGAALRPRTSKPFSGVKVNGGTVSVSEKGHALVLTLSDDFEVPETPAPHWQVVDSRGQAHLLQRLVIKGDKLNKSIEVPSYVLDVAKVQIWCAFAEVNLGETTFDSVVMLPGNHRHESTAFAGAKANKGFVTHTVEGGKNVLTLSPDFVIPDTPAPHWQVVDSRGNVHLLQRLKIKGDVEHRSIVLPDSIADVSKVQIWCAFAETLLGEASFSAPVP